MKTRIKKIEWDERKPAHVKKPVTLTGFINETEVAFIRATDWGDEGAVNTLPEFNPPKSRRLGA